jgi:hypothetical protein
LIQAFDNPIFCSLVADGQAVHGGDSLSNRSNKPHHPFGQVLHLAISRRERIPRWLPVN